LVNIYLSIGGKPPDPLEASPQRALVCGRIGRMWRGGRGGTDVEGRTWRDGRGGTDVEGRTWRDGRGGMWMGGRIGRTWRGGRGWADAFGSGCLRLLIYCFY